MLPVYQRHLTLVFAITLQQIGGVEPWLATPEEQVSELGLAMTVESDDLAIRDPLPREEHLPTVLSQEEVARLIDSVLTRSSATSGSEVGDIPFCPGPLGVTLLCGLRLR